MTTQMRIASRSPQGMQRFLLASIVLHAIGALSWVPAVEFAGNRDADLTVNFEAPRSDHGQPEKRTAAVERESRNTMTVPTHIATATRASTENEAPTENGPEHQSLSAETLSQSVRTQIEAQLLTDLQRFFEYPLLARRRGWQGTVWLGFTLESNGTLERIHVARSSGYDALDDSAIAALKRVGRLSQDGHRLNGLAFDMSIPVVYRLKDN